MQHLQGRQRIFRNENWSHGLRRSRLRPARNTEDALVLMLENFEEIRLRLVPVFENPGCARAAGQIPMTCDEIKNELKVAWIAERFQIHRLQIAALRGKIAALIVDVGNPAAHAGGKVPAARAQN